MKNNNLSIGTDWSSRSVLIDPTQESERMLSTLISNLPGMVYRCLNDEYYTMLFVSKRITEICGCEPEDVINNNKFPFIDLIHPDDRERIWDKTQIALKKRKSFRLDYRIVDLKGNTKWIWEQGVGVFDNEDNLLGLEGFIIDITDKINLERELEKAKNLALLGEFSSAVAHQVRNPLGECLLSVKLMQRLLQTIERDDGDDSGEGDKLVLTGTQRDTLKSDILNLIKSIKDLNSIVTQILNYTKNTKLRCSTHKIDVLFNDLLSPYKEKFEEHGIKIVLNIEENISDISVDAILISQAFQNVIDNSIEALQNGGYFLIYVVKFDNEKRTIVITFSDSGEGIEDENVKNIFRPFYTTKTSGTGLGLSFARRVIEAHNGKIWVCSKNSCKSYYNNECKKARKINGKYLSGTSIHIMLPTNLD